MYEMEGPRLAHAALVAGCPAAVRHEAATGRVPRRRITGLPGLGASRSRLRSKHVFSGEAVLPLRLPRTQGLWSGPAEKLPSSTGHLPFIPCPSPLSTAHPQPHPQHRGLAAAPQPPQRPPRSAPAILAAYRHPAAPPSGAAPRRKDVLEWTPAGSAARPPGPRGTGARRGCGPSRRPSAPPASWPAGASPSAWPAPRAPSQRPPRPRRTAPRATAAPQAPAPRPAVPAPRPAAPAPVPVPVPVPGGSHPPLPRRPAPTPAR